MKSNCSKLIHFYFSQLRARNKVHFLYCNTVGSNGWLSNRLVGWLVSSGGPQDEDALCQKSSPYIGINLDCAIVAQYSRMFHIAK